MGTKKNNKALQLRQFFEHSVDASPNNLALICGNHSLSYKELEVRANQLANYLISQGVSEQDSIGILMERSLESYISILAVLKTGAAYVPIEVEYPDERINYILADMPFHSVLTTSTQFERNENIKFPPAIIIDQIESIIAQQPKNRPQLTQSVDEQLCYVIYTSGSTGKPKGVEITHKSICHYVSVASQLYSMSSDDRVYQGFSLAFDASLEEFWMALANGGTLVACTLKDIRSGVGLVDFLNDHKVTVFSTVPTLLSTLEGELPHLRLLVLGGEACSANLVNRWSRKDLTIMNTYGPTEATVIATYSECQPDKPVTIGKPLPGFEVLILDDKLQPVANGQQGELCIAGIGLSRGYVNRPEMTASKFVINPHNEKQRLYRTGDLALIDTGGDIQFMGRVDDQIKLRGFRIELTEIEAIMMEFGGLSQVVVALQELEIPTLVAYLLIDKNTELDIQAFKRFLIGRLPHYMMPALFEQVESFPLLSSGKVNRKELPKPKTVFQQNNYVAPKTKLEKTITKIWEENLQHHRISVEDDLFYDLGGHSLSAAQIVSKLRKINGMQDISVLDLYRNPTIKQLAEKFGNVQANKRVDNKESLKHKPSSLSYFLCSVGQFFGCLIQYALGAWQLLAVVVCYAWVESYTTALSKEGFLVFLLLFFGMPVVSLAITVCAKWILVGRIKPGTYKLWGWFYLRWWLVQRLQSNIFSPGHFIGSPLINAYYRLLGAKIGKNCYLGSCSVAIHDLLTIGDNSSIGLDSRLRGYVVEDGWLKIGPITIGNNCFVGSRTVLGIDTVMHDNSCLDDMSLLPNNTQIPAHQFFTGSPACLATVPADHITNQTKVLDNTSPLKNFTYGILHYLCLVFAMMLHYTCYFPALLLITHFYEQTQYLVTVFFAAPLGAIIFLGLYLFGVSICKKLMMNKISPGTYSLKSFYYLRQWTIVKMLDIEEVAVMADSLYFPYVLRFLGAKLGKRVEMGSTPHLIPDLITIKDEGFTASSVALAWPSVYQGSVKFAPVQIGKRGFVGNVGLLPLGSKVGDGGLLGCMSITPPNNQAASNHTAWLGSPAIFLPKRELFVGFSDKETFTPPRRLFNTRLAIELFRMILPATLTLIGFFSMLYVLNILQANYSLKTTFFLLPVAELLIVLGLVAAVILLKWTIIGKLKAATKPLWSAYIWKIDIIEYAYSYFINQHLTDVVLGTPFASMLLRCLGAKIGKRVFIDTEGFAEFDLISIGDDVCLNAETLIQTHLYEDRIFKTSTIKINDGCNVGVASIVLYDTVMEKNSSLGSFSLLMKGERLPENTSWQGIPAQSTRAHEELPTTEPVDVADDSLILEVE